MKIKTQLRSTAAGSLAVITSLAFILFASSACQSKKGAKGPDLVGKNVKMTELRQVIQTRISEPRRSAALINMVGNAEHELGAINGDFIKYSKKFGKITANHAKGASDLHLILQEWEAQTSARRLRLVEVLMGMKGQATAKEWPAISNAFMNSVTKQSDRYKVLHHVTNS